MGTFLSMVYQTIKVFIIFTGCTILFYYGIIWINEEYQNYHRYDEPEGAAIKVSTLERQQEQTFFDRLIWFYINGE